MDASVTPKMLSVISLKIAGKTKMLVKRLLLNIDVSRVSHRLILSTTETGVSWA